MYVYCMDLRTNSNFFHLNHYQMGFITEVERVYCAVRTESLYV